MARLSKEHHEALDKVHSPAKTPTRRASKFRELFNRKSMSPVVDNPIPGNTPTPSIRSPSVRPSFEIVGLLPGERASTKDVATNEPIEELEENVPVASHATVPPAAVNVTEENKIKFSMNPPPVPKRGQQRYSLPAELPATTIPEEKKLKMKYSEEELKYIATTTLAMMPPSPEGWKTVDITKKGTKTKEIDVGPDAKEKVEVMEEEKVKGKGKGKAVKKDVIERKGGKQGTRKSKVAQTGDEKEQLPTDEDECSDSFKSDYSDADSELDAASVNTRMFSSAFKEPEHVIQIKLKVSLTLPAYFHIGVANKDAIVPSIWYGLRDILSETAPERITCGPLNFTSRGAVLGLYAMSVGVYAALFILAVCRGPIEIFASAARIASWLVGYMVVMHHSPWAFLPEHDVVMAPLVGLGGMVPAGNVASLRVGVEVEKSSM